MTRLTAIFVFILFVQMSSYGQDGRKNVFRGGGGYVSLGANIFHIASLDNSLRRYQLPEFGSGRMNYTIGGGGGSFINSFYFGGYGEAHIGPSASNALYKNKMSGGQGLVKVGYTLVHKESFILYPAFGAGGGGTTLKVDAGPQYVEDPDLLLQPGTRLHTGYMLLNVGLNSDFFIGSKTSTSGGLMLGLSAGYQFSPLGGRWEYDDHSVPELDKYDPSGFYLRLRMGWASNQPR